jgi:hypothetical protein
MSDVPPEIDPAGCGGGIAVAADRRSAVATDAPTSTAASRVVLACGGRVRGRLRVEFRLEGANWAYFGYALVGADTAQGAFSRDVGTHAAWDNYNHSRGLAHCAAFRPLPAGSPAALLFDAAAGTLAYEVNGEGVGTLFWDLRGLAIVPVFFLGGSTAMPVTRLVITRVLSGAGARAREAPPQPQPPFGGSRVFLGASLHAFCAVPPNVRALISLRALCLEGRARAAPNPDDGGEGSRSVVQWLCGAAPLWVVVRVASLLVVA